LTSFPLKSSWTNIIKFKSKNWRNIFRGIMPSCCFLRNNTAYRRHRTDFSSIKEGRNLCIGYWKVLSYYLIILISIQCWPNAIYHQYIRFIKFATLLISSLGLDNVSITSQMANFLSCFQHVRGYFHRQEYCSNDRASALPECDRLIIFRFAKARLYRRFLLRF
jgi:hypothetical protein